MKIERWQRIKDVFATLLELAPEERAARLAATLPDDPSLAAEVEDLLAAHDGADDFYERGALAAVPAVRQQLEGVVPGTLLGPYRVIRELGRGGMGAVYLAERDEPGFHQRVAIKLVKRGMDTDEIVRRFRAERQILASLSHPNIARLFDGGSAPDGRPYFVMEYIEGRPITAFAEERKLSVEARLRLFLKAAAAVQAAHQSLVVHRDLKPANLLVDETGEPKLLDFGIAKLLDPGGERTALTGSRRGPMTPDYASPEQKTGAPATTATDVYGLGLLLYELLVGLAPGSVERRLGPGWGERPPSQVMKALAAPADADQRRLARRLAGDLDTIVGKALEEEPDRRYATAAAFAEDIERHLARRPVVARRPTLAYRLQRTLVRHKTLALGLGVCAGLGLALLVQHERARAQSARAEALTGFLQHLIEQVDPEKGGSGRLTARQIPDLGARMLASDSRYPPETAAALLEVIGKALTGQGLYPEAQQAFEQALVLRDSALDPSGESRLAKAADLTALGEVLYDREDYPASRRYHGEAVALKRRLLGGAAAAALAEDWNGLGAVALAEGKLEEAGARFHDALTACREPDERGPRNLAETYANLGALAERQGNLQLARVDFSMALRFFRSSLGEDHPITTQVRANLACLLFQGADYAGAEALYQQVVATRRRLLEPTHPDLAWALLQLAIVERQRGRLPEAGAILDELMRLRRGSRLPHDETEAETWNLLGAVALDRKELDAAGKAFAQSFAMYRTLPGDHRSNLSAVLINQALLRQRQGDLSAAAELARHSLELARSVQGRASDLAAPLQLLADLLKRAGNLRGAEAAYRELLALGSPSTPAVRAGLLIEEGDLLLELGKTGEGCGRLREGKRLLPIREARRDARLAKAERLLKACPGREG